MLQFSIYNHILLTHPFLGGGKEDMDRRDRFPENPEPCHKALQARRCFHPLSYKFCSESFHKNVNLKSLVKIVPQLQHTKHADVGKSLIYTQLAFSPVKRRYYWPWSHVLQIAKLTVLFASSNAQVAQ